MSAAKARMASRMLGKVVGGKLGTALMVGYLGKKAWDMTRNKRRTARVRTY
jgi:hypothetical protein